MSDDIKIPGDARTVLPGQAVSYHNQGRQALIGVEPVADVIDAPPDARPIVIEHWFEGDRFTMTITRRAQPVMASYCCQINDVEVPGPVFELALRLAMGGSW